MSHIDEAFRRVAAGDCSPEDPPAAPPNVPAGESMLSLYAAEKPTRATVPLQSAAMRALSGPGEPATPAFTRRTDEKLVVSAGTDSATVEQYRRLAAALHEVQVHRGIRTLMVSSAVPREGKTLTTVNLALTLAQSLHRRVLLIDADLRRPSVHDHFSLPNRAGVTEFVRGDLAAPPFVDVSQWLSVLPAGRAHMSPLAMLTSDRLQSVIADAATHFDWVLLDTPPVGILPDAQLVAHLAEAIVFVIAAGSTPYALVKRCLAELGPDRIVGTVLNRVRRDGTSMHDTYGSYYINEPARNARRWFARGG